MITIDIKLTDDRLKNIADEVRSKASALVRRTAFAVEREAKVNAPVDTGFLRNSIYTVTDRGNGYDRALASATRLGAKRHAGERRSSLTGEWRSTEGLMLDAVEEADLPGDLTAIVAVGAKYGIHVEYLHKPFFTPAVDSARRDWDAGLRELFE
jgi:hypothetical protein